VCRRSLPCRADGAERQPDSDLEGPVAFAVTAFEQ